MDKTNPTLADIRQRQQEIRTEIRHIQKSIFNYVKSLTTPSMEIFSPTWMSRLLVRVNTAVRIVKKVKAVWRTFKK